jgi:hypothetical protein
LLKITNYFVDKDELKIEVVIDADKIQSLIATYGELETEKVLGHGLLCEIKEQDVIGLII